MDPQDPQREDLTEVKQALGCLKQWGIELVNVSVGSPYYNPHIGRPFEKPDEGNYEQPEHPLLGVDRHFRIAGELQKSFPGLAMVGTGYSWLQKYAINAGAYNVANGLIRFPGIGRGVAGLSRFRARCPGKRGARRAARLQNPDLLHVPDAPEAPSHGPVPHRLPALR